MECNLVTEQMKASQAYQSYLNSLYDFQKSLKDNYKENYSFMEFYHYMTQDIADGETFRIIGNVLRAFLHKHCLTVGYNKVNSNYHFLKDIFDLSVFLLMFLSPAKAWVVMCKVYEDIVPKECYPLNFQINNFKLNQEVITWICQILQDRFRLQTNLIPKVKEFIESEGLDYFSSFLILKLNIQVTFYLINYIFNSKDKYAALVKCITCVTSLNSESINILGSTNPKTIRMILEAT